jgi:amidophosphoribosyltransferase
MSFELNEECGIFGISLNDKSPDLIKDLYLGIFALQHRGQESSGIAYRKNGDIDVIKGKGLVTGELFEMLPLDVETSLGIGHVRYSTCGGSNIVNAQPLVFKCNKGEISIAHNGNIPNSDEIKNELIQNGSIFQTLSDSEILIHLMSRIPGNDFKDSLITALRNIKGAYSMLMMHDDQLIAFRDPYGFRPLSFGQIDGGHVFSSETNALDLIGARNIRDVRPGEIIFCKGSKIESQTFAGSEKLQQCVFELIYFARPDSIVFGESVYDARIRMGEKLSIKNGHEIDLVISIPDSGNSAALGFSKHAKKPFEFGMIRNHYTGRTFIRPEQKTRTEGVKIKLNPVKSVISGKRIAVIDDSIVRGTTSRQIVQMLLEAGAKEVHMFFSSPEIKHSCFFGIDTPTEKELISSEKSPQQVAKDIGADSANFLELDDLKSCLKNPENYCYACYDGKYCINIKHGKTC